MAPRTPIQRTLPTLRIWLLALTVCGLLAATLPLPASAATTPALPSSMAAVGDSITQAASSGGSLGTDYPQNSWSTGTNTTVNSQYLRLLAIDPEISGHAYNDSVSGAKMADLNGQITVAVARRPDYLTVLIGGNDLCTDTVSQMTPVATFQSEFKAAMDTLTLGSPNTHVFVASITNVYQLWQLFHNNWWARVVWSLGNICQSLLANPTSTNATDVARRAEVAQRNVDYNNALQQVCATYANCLFDGDAVYNVAFSSSDVAGDYFHPSIAGQAKLASVTWGAGYWPNGAPPSTNPPTASFTSSCSGLTCSFNASASSGDNQIASYAWSFGDGATETDTAATTSHTYGADQTYSVTLTVTDTAGLTDSVSKDVAVTAPPNASFSSLCPDLTCTFDASLSTAGSNPIASYSWDFGDGNNGTGVTTSHTYAASGTYTVSLIVSDTAGLSDTATQSVDVSATPPAATMHVVALDGSSTSRKGGWTASISVTIADANGKGVGGATVRGTWTTGSSGSCTTGSDGTCSFTTNMNKKTVSATYSITDVSAPGYAYDLGANTVDTSVTLAR